MKIPINTATAEELTQLYDVGSTLAQQIVAYRTQHGPFRGPDDLSKIKGISFSLALTLSPHIEWGQDAKQAEADQFWSDPTPDIPMFLFFVGIVVALIWFKGRAFPEQFQMVITYFERGFSWTGTILTLLLTVDIVQSSSSFFICLAMMTLSVANRNSVIRLGFQIMMASLYVNIYCQLLITLVIFIVFSWAITIRARFDISLLMVLNEGIGSIFMVLVTSAALVVYSPQNIRIARLLSLRFLRAIFVAGFWGLLITLAIRLWLDGVNTLTDAVSMGLGGLVYTYSAINSIRSRESSLEQVARFADRVLTGVVSNKHEYWISWANTHVPHPDDQKQLQKALNQIYPPSSANTILNLVVIGIGGWLVLTAAGAIVEYFVQGWLSIFFS